MADESWRAVRRAILFFVKLPEPGKVKTRLAATVGTERAAEIYQMLVARICAALPADVQVIVMCDPPDSGAAVEDWIGASLRGAEFHPQAAGDLGVRLERAFADAFARGFEKVAAIGSDCIDLGDAIFDETWRALDACDCVIGPADDGGYYLLALRQPCPRLFFRVEWSTDRVFAQTIERAEAAALRVRLLPRLHDVDTEEDWRRAERGLML